MPAYIIRPRPAPSGAMGTDSIFHQLQENLP